MSKSFKIDGRRLRDSLRVICPFASDNRRNLMGILFKWSDGCLCLVAVDGHRLIEHKQRDVFFTGEGEADFTAIFPRQSLGILNSLLAESQDIMLEVMPVKQGDDLLQFKFSNPDASITIKALDATFPDYEKVFPARKNVKSGLNARYLYDALAVFADSGNKEALNGLTIDIHYDGDEDGSEPKLITANGMGDTQVVLMPKIVP